MLPNTEVSEVSSVALVPFSQEVTPSQGESFKTIKPNTWFQSMTNHFKEALGQWVTAVSCQHHLPMCRSTLVNT